MRRSTGFLLYAASVVAGVLVLTVPPWHRPVPGTQIGQDGSGSVQFADTSPWRVAPAPSEPVPAPDPATPIAPFRNVTVLTDVAPAEFMRLQSAMTAWVSPKQGCAFCHTGDDFASDANPMKAVTRDMLRLTRYLNTTWKGHFGEGGVTCFSCHRGEPVPPETWFPSEAKPIRPFVARSENWDETADTVRKFFPDNGWSLYLLGDEPIRAESRTALRSETVGSQVEVKRVYEMMMQMSDGIGVNCGFCHSSRAFSDWSQSTPQRWVGFDAIRMTRDINRTFLFGLRDTFPQTRELVKQNSLVTPHADRGPRNGSGLAVCATCHYGHLKPDGGTATLAAYGALGSSVNATPAALPVEPNPAAPAPVAPAPGRPD